MPSTVETTATTTRSAARTSLPLGFPASVVVARPLDEIRVVRLDDDHLQIAEDERLHRYTALLSAGVIMALVALIQLIIGLGGWMQAVWLWGITAVTLTMFLISIRPFGIRLVVRRAAPQLVIHTTFLGIKRERLEIDLSEFMLCKGCRMISAVGGTETVFTCVAVHPDEESKSLHVIGSCKEGVIDRILDQIEVVLPQAVLAGQHMEPDEATRPGKPR